MSKPSDSKPQEFRIELDLNLKLLFIVPLIGVTVVSLFQLYRETAKVHQYRQKVPYQFLGIKFTGLEDILKNVEFMGYYTDKDLDVNEHAQQFSQAQYELAPVVLDLNNTEHEYIFFDCTTEDMANQKIAQINAIPLKKNKFGVILAKRKMGQRPF